MVKRSRLEALEELRTFVAIAEAGSLASAAKVLGVTPNAVSRRLGILEERLDRRLVHRTTRRLAMTEEGKRFQARCRRILDEVDEAECELLGVDGPVGMLRLGIHPDMVSATLIAALRELSEGNPSLEIELRVSSNYVDPIAAGLDLSVCVGRPPSSSLMSVPLGDLVWTLAAAPAYVERRGKPRSPKELADHECLRVLRDSPETHWSLSRGKGPPHRYTIHGRFQTTDSRALTEALYAGLGIGVGLRSDIDSAVQAGRLEHVLPGWQWACTPVTALLPKGRTKVPAIRLVLDALRRATRGLAHDGARAN